MRPFLSFRPFLVMAVAAALLCGCNVQKTGEGANKKVDIETPLGSVHVNPQAEPKDVGLAVYPGASRSEESGHAASVEVGFGEAKVLVFKYRSDDPPGKLLDFYRKELGKYGEVMECHGSVSIVAGHVICTNTAPLDETNLITDTKEQRRIVSVKPDGSGSKFTLLYLQSSREKETL